MRRAIARFGAKETDRKEELPVTYRKFRIMVGWLLAAVAAWGAGIAPARLTISWIPGHLRAAT